MVRNNQKQKQIPFYQKVSLILLGLFLTLFILELGLRIGGFVILSLQEHRNLRSIRQKEEYRIMCLGESTTQNQYSPYLELILIQRNIGIKFAVIDKGVGGTDTTAILSQLEANLDKYRPDLVVAMMGVNDPHINTPYEIVRNSKAPSFFNSFRVNKLSRLIWLHVASKRNKLRLANAANHNQPAKNQQEPDAKKELEEQEPKNYYLESKYKSLGQFHLDRGELSEAEQALNKAIELNPAECIAHILLARVYRMQKKAPEAIEQHLKKALELSQNNFLFNSAAYQELGLLYSDQARLPEAEQAFKKAMPSNLNQGTIYAHADLALFYKDKKRLPEAEQTLKKAAELYPNSDFIFACLATLYREMGRDDLSKLYSGKAEVLRGLYYSSMTVNNYHRLKQILDKRKIGLVCVQYPVRSIAPLKKIFEGEEGVIFVDNEKIFKGALERESYKKYFVDQFGGDFGHCTPKGNRLLAENIANTVLKEVFRGQ